MHIICTSLNGSTKLHSFREIILKAASFGSVSLLNLFFGIAKIEIFSTCKKRIVNLNGRVYLK